MEAGGGYSMVALQHRIRRRGRPCEGQRQAIRIRAGTGVEDEGLALTHVIGSRVGAQGHHGRRVSCFVSSESLAQHDQSLVVDAFYRDSVRACFQSDPGKLPRRGAGPFGHCPWLSGHADLVDRRWTGASQGNGVIRSLRQGSGDGKGGVPRSPDKVAGRGFTTVEP